MTHDNVSRTQLYLAAIPTALPDIGKGIRTKAC